MPAWRTMGSPPLSQVAHLEHVGHEAGEVLDVAPEEVDLVERRVDVDGLVDVEAAPALCAEEAAELHVGGATRQERGAGKRGGGADGATAAERVEGEGA